MTGGPTPRGRRSSRQTAMGRLMLYLAPLRRSLPGVLGAPGARRANSASLAAKPPSPIPRDGVKAIAETPTHLRADVLPFTSMRELLDKIGYTKVMPKRP